MRIVKFETWWVKRDKCLFDQKRKGKSAMDWDVMVLKLTTDNGIEGVATAMAARSGQVTESYLRDNIAPVVLGRSPYDREAIWHELWNIDRHEAFFPVFLPQHFVMAIDQAFDHRPDAFPPFGASQKPQASHQFLGLHALLRPIGRFFNR